MSTTLGFDPFQTWFDRWELALDGEPFTSVISHLAPVRYHSAAAMLKVTQAPEEIAGGALMEWWGGVGAAKVLAREGEGLLMERATGPGSLAVMARDGRDDEACQIMCAVGAGLHRARTTTAPDTLVPLQRWFQALWPTAKAQGGLFARSAEAARRLLDDPRELSVLHGDLHHGNVLDFADRGWLAIDPKGLFGDRGYDHANMLCNPDVETALEPGRFERRLAVVSQAAGIDQVRLASWVLAYAGLSASWTLMDNRFGKVSDTLNIVEKAAAFVG